MADLGLITIDLDDLYYVCGECKTPIAQHDELYDTMPMERKMYTAVVNVVASGPERVHQSLTLVDAHCIKCRHHLGYKDIKIPEEFGALVNNHVYLAMKELQLWDGSKIVDLELVRADPNQEAQSDLITLEKNAKFYVCARCQTHIASMQMYLSCGETLPSEPVGYLFKEVFNVLYGSHQNIGPLTVEYAHCTICKTFLGFKYVEVPMNYGAIEPKDKGLVQLIRAKLLYWDGSNFLDYQSLVQLHLERELTAVLQQDGAEELEQVLQEEVQSDPEQEVPNIQQELQANPEQEMGADLEQEVQSDPEHEVQPNIQQKRKRGEILSID